MKRIIQNYLYGFSAMLADTVIRKYRNVLTGDRDWGLFFGEIKKQDGQDMLVMKRKLYTHYNLLSRVPKVPDMTDLISAKEEK